MSRTTTFAVAIATAAGLGVLASPPAAASPVAQVGPGTGWFTAGSLDTTTTCSIGAVGYDGGGRLVALTAGHCILAPGLPVSLTANPAAGPVGVTVTGHWGPDYGVVVLDPARVAPVNSIGGVTVTGVGNVATGAPVCKTGQTTGTTCGSVLAVDAGRELVSDAFTAWGDSGGPLVVGTTLVGLVSRPVGPALLTPTGFAPAGASLDGLNASGGPGAGFRVLGS